LEEEDERLVLGRTETFKQRCMRRQLPLQAFNKCPMQMLVSRFTATAPWATVHAKPSLSGGAQFGLLQHVGHVRPQ
jgi:hypothetical protein